MLDRIFCRVGTVTSCVPEFWLSLVLILLFAVELRWLPSSGAYSVGGNGGRPDRAVHLILPVTVVVLGHLWYYAYLVRNRLLEELHADYVLLAKGKGLPKRTDFLRHCAAQRPAVVSFDHGDLRAARLGGTYIVESVFSYPDSDAQLRERAVSGLQSADGAVHDDGRGCDCCNLLAQAISGAH